jgi:hypothetical protein
MPSQNPTASLEPGQNMPYRLNPYTPTNSNEKRTGQRLTVPDQSLTVKEILSRFTRGQRIPDAAVGYYDAENDPLELDGVNIETLDLSQKYDLLEAQRRKARTMKARYEKQERDTYNETLRKEGEARVKQPEAPPPAAP